MTQWRVRLGDVAEADFARILKYTTDRFGTQQAKVYKITLIKAIEALQSGPNVLGSIARNEILPNLRTLHVARKGRRGRHFILYRAAPDHVIEVVRILNDVMDLSRHVSHDII